MLCIIYHMSMVNHSIWNFEHLLYVYCNAYCVGGILLVGIICNLIANHDMLVWSMGAVLLLCHCNSYNV